MKTILATIAALAVITAPLLLTSCHTVKGFGQDVQTSGKALSRAASRGSAKDS